VLIHGPVHVPPDAGDLDIGLVDEPAGAHSVAARPGRVDHQWRKVLHPSVQGDVIHLYPSFGQELLDVAIGQAEPQIPPHLQ
jgi:hypothetical protein